jgi:predicted ArsR family transcriptional regulator
VRVGSGAVVVAPSALSRIARGGRRPSLRERVLLSLVHRYEPASATAIARTIGAAAKHVARALREFAAEERAVCVAEVGGRKGRGGRTPALWVAAEEPRGLFGWGGDQRRSA